MTAPLLDIRNARLWRGDTLVFENLSLRIDVGERVAIIGPNGSGKTTLLKTLNREIYPVHTDHSHVRVLGRDDWNVWELRRHIGLVSHDLHAAYPGDSRVLDLVISGFHSSIGIHGTLAEKVTPGQAAAAESALERVGLSDVADRELRLLSTGQQRRCFLARALAHGPHTLILDEPTAGMDMKAAFQFVRYLRSLDDCNVILVTHHVNEIPPEVNRVIGLKHGRVVIDDTKDNALTSKALSFLFDTDIRIAEAGGYYLASPGNAS